MASDFKGVFDRFAADYYLLADYNYYYYLEVDYLAGDGYTDFYYDLVKICGVGDFDLI